MSLAVSKSGLIDGGLYKKQVKEGRAFRPSESLPRNFSLPNLKLDAKGNPIYPTSHHEPHGDHRFYINDKKFTKKLKHPKPWSSSSDIGKREHSDPNHMNRVSFYQYHKRWNTKTTAESYKQEDEAKKASIPHIEMDFGTETSWANIDNINHYVDASNESSTMRPQSLRVGTIQKKQEALRVTRSDYCQHPVTWNRNVKQEITKTNEDLKRWQHCAHEMAWYNSPL